MGSFATQSLNFSQTFTSYLTLGKGVYSWGYQEGSWASGVLPSIRECQQSGSFKGLLQKNIAILTQDDHIWVQLAGNNHIPLATKKRSRLLIMSTKWNTNSNLCYTDAKTQDSASSGSLIMVPWRDYHQLYYCTVSGRLKYPFMETTL